MAKAKTEATLNSCRVTHGAEDTGQKARQKYKGIPTWLPSDFYPPSQERVFCFFLLTIVNHCLTIRLTQTVISKRRCAASAELIAQSAN